MNMTQALAARDAAKAAGDRAAYQAAAEVVGRLVRLEKAAEAAKAEDITAALAAVAAKSRALHAAVRADNRAEGRGDAERAYRLGWPDEAIQTSRGTNPASSEQLAMIRKAEGWV